MWTISQYDIMYPGEGNSRAVNHLFVRLDLPPMMKGDGAMITNDYILDAIIVIVIAIVLKRILDRRKK